jgi:hypothetical protein
MTRRSNTLAYWARLKVRKKINRSSVLLNILRSKKIPSACKLVSVGHFLPGANVIKQYRGKLPW